MKKLLLVLSLLASLNIEAQFVTTLAKQVPETQEDGIFYYLPKTVVKLEFTVEETHYYVGPYAEFATKLLGSNDHIKENKTITTIKSVDIQTVKDIDPSALFFISLDEKSKDPLPNIILDEDGVILSYGYDKADFLQNTDDKDNSINELAEELKPVTFIEILDNEVELDDDDEEEGGAAKKITKEDKAKVALEHINKIRSAYFDLISGANEVNYGNTMSIMTDDMKALENEYVNLFKGKVSKNIYKKTVYVTPEANQGNASLPVAKIGESVKIQFESNNTLSNITKTSDEAKSAGQINKLFYRIPAKSNVKILVGNQIIAQKQLIISQFGDIRIVSVKNNKVLFDQNTGQIISITH